VSPSRRFAQPTCRTDHLRRGYVPRRMRPGCGSSSKLQPSTPLSNGCPLAHGYLSDKCARKATSPAHSRCAVVAVRIKKGRPEERPRFI
jgi:hypothetical protein